ncbi:MAG: hypothetical protein PVJ89_12715 [Planctomycetota bacterium]
MPHPLRPCAAAAALLALAGVAPAGLGGATASPLESEPQRESERPPRGAQDPARDWLELPEAPMGRLWASVGADTVPWSPPGAAGDLASDAGAWGEWVSALAALEDAAGRREALRTLVALAVRDGRVEDAYGWIAAFGAGDAPALAGALPRLFPGFDGSVALGPGGRPAAMPSDATLRPQLPPRSPAAIPGSIEPRRATARRVTVGAATFDLMLKVDGSGVVLELTHVAGAAADLRVALPAPAGYRLKSVYVDWELQAPEEGADPDDVDWAGTPLPVHLTPAAAEEPLTLFARLDRRDVPLPTAPDAAAPLPAGLARAGLLVVVPEGASGPRWSAMAEAFGGALGIPVRVVPPAAVTGRPAGPVPTALRFDLAADPEALRRRVTAAIEARARG